MYIKINDQIYSDIKRIYSKYNGNIIFIGKNLPDPNNIENIKIIETYRNDNFLLYIDNVNNFNQIIIQNNSIQLIKEKNPEPFIEYEENYSSIINKLILSNLEV